jgi:hypothetical protein
MKISVNTLKKALSMLEKANALDVDVRIDLNGGIDKFTLEFEDLKGTETVIKIAESNSGGFDFISRLERF